MNGRTATVAYTGATRTEVATSPEQRQLVAVFDAQERLLEAELVGLEPVLLGYDDRGRLASISQGQGAAERLTALAYDAAGNLASVTDPLLRTTTYEHDAAGRVERMTLPGARVVELGYDANGNLEALQPPGQPAHLFRYTLLDQEAEYEPPPVDPGDPRTISSYDLDRALTFVDRPDGSFVDPAYDFAGRLASVAIPRGTTTASHHPTTGQLTGLSAPGGEGLAFTWDGPLLTSTAWSGTLAGSVEHAYDTDFRVASQTVNGAHAVSFAYDGDGLLTAAGALALGLDPDTGLATSTALGSVTTATAYNGFGEPTGETASVGGSPVYATTLTRDALGRITREVEAIEGIITTTDYDYGAAGRLEHVHENGALVRSYAYDPNGNRLSVTDTTTGPTAGSYDDQDRLVGYGTTSYVHDAAGDLVSHTDSATLETTSFAYDALGSLTQVDLPDGRTITYVIDGQNRRIGKRIDGVLVQGWLYQDPLDPVAELDGAGNVVSRFVYGTKAHVPDYLVKGGNTYRILSDHLGSVRLVVDASTGTVVQRLDYDEFGNITADSNPGFQPFAFAGGIYDADTKLTRFGARDYDAEIGRWTTKDPIRFDGGTNLYGYVLNDPVNFIDPLGLLNPTKFAVGVANSFQGISNTAQGVTLVGAGSGAIISTPVTGPIGAVSGTAATAVGSAKIAFGIGGLRRGLHQINQALDEPWDSASTRNLYGLLPNGQKFDDPCEPTAGQYFGNLWNTFAADPYGAAKKAIRDFFVF